MHQSSDADIERLLADRGWLERLARGLVRDPAAAEDLAQDTLVRALERDAPRGTSRQAVRGWLASILRRLAIDRHRADVRRRTREAAVASFEAGDAGALERAVLRRDIVDEVLHLAEPERSAITLRYLEDLPYPQIAIRQGVTEAAVRQRVSRGLARLRARLDEQPGGRAAWWAIVLPWIPEYQGPVAAPTGVALNRSIAMKTSTKIATAAAVLVLGGAGLSAWLRPPAVIRSGETSARTRSESLDVAVSPSLASVPESADGRRMSADASAAPARITSIVAFPDRPRAETGTLRIRVRWEDGTAAFGVRARILSWGDATPDQRQISIVTDGAGVAVAEGIVAGLVAVSLDRADGGMFDVLAGALTVADLTIPRGFEVVGRVETPSGEAVAGADIVLSNGGRGGMVVGRTDATGEYRVRDLARGYSISARAPGHGPSALHRIDDMAAGEASEIDLELRAGGCVMRGRVVDESGTPIRGARLRVKFSREWVSAVTFNFRHSIDLESDDDGQFEVHESGSGPFMLEAQTEAHVPTTLALDPDGSPELTVTVVMEIGGTVTGTVRREGGDLAGAAVITAVNEEGHDLDPIRRAMARADGTFVMTGLTPGRTRLRATEHDHGKVFTALSIRKGETVVWDATLDAARTVVGRVVDERGAGLAGWMVRTKTALNVWDRSAKTDTGGDFRLTDVREGARVLHVTVRNTWGRASVATSSITTGPMVIRVPDDALPTCACKVLICVAGRAPEPPALVLVVARNGVRGKLFTDANGEVTIAALCPGEAEITITLEGLAPARRDVTLSPNETLDAGVIELTPGGRIRAEFVAEDSADDSAEDSVESWRLPSQLMVYDGRGRLVTYFDLVDGRGTSDAIEPGEYTVRHNGTVRVALPLEVVIVDGDVTELRRDVAPSGRALITLVLPEALHPESEWTYEVSGPLGEVLTSGSRSTSGSVPGPPCIHLWNLPAGRSTVRVNAESGFRGELQIEVTDLGGRVVVEAELLLTAGG